MYTSVVYKFTEKGFFLETACFANCFEFQQVTEVRRFCYAIRYNSLCGLFRQRSYKTTNNRVVKEASCLALRTAKNGQVEIHT